MVFNLILKVVMFLRFIDTGFEKKRNVLMSPNSHETWQLPRIVMARTWFGVMISYHDCMLMRTSFNDVTLNNKQNNRF